MRKMKFKFRLPVSQENSVRSRRKRGGTSRGGGSISVSFMFSFSYPSQALNKYTAKRLLLIVLNTFQGSTNSENHFRSEKYRPPPPFNQFIYSLNSHQ